MNEDLIVQALDRSCQEPSLCFQVIQEASYLSSVKVGKVK